MSEMMLFLFHIFQQIRRTYPYQPLPRFPSKRIHKFDQNREFCVTRMNELKKFMAQVCWVAKKRFRVACTSLNNE